jgi:hypothetical protein
MRLISRIVFIAALVPFQACSDAVAPPRISAFYTLLNIDGRPLPTFDFDPTDRVLSATLALDKTGHAVLTQRRIINNQEIETSTNYSYSLSGDHVTFDFLPPCTGPVLCATLPVGIIDGLNFQLIWGPMPDDSSVFYNFAEPPTL